MNKVNEAEKVRNRVKQGFPSGVDEESAKDLKILLMRIDELETALRPFANIANIPTSNELVYCYFRDCRHAHDIMKQDVNPKQMTEYYYPA